MRAGVGPVLLSVCLLVALATATIDPYRVLNVGRNATPQEIRKAYHVLAKQHHPDKGGDEAEFKKVAEAYEILSDPNRRKLYDQGNLFDDSGSYSHPDPFQTWEDFAAEFNIPNHGFGEVHARMFDKIQRMHQKAQEDLANSLSGIEEMLNSMNGATFPDAHDQFDDPASFSTTTTTSTSHGSPGQQSFTQTTTTSHDGSKGRTSSTTRKSTSTTTTHTSHSSSSSSASASAVGDGASSSSMSSHSYSEGGKTCTVTKQCVNNQCHTTKECF